MAARKPREKKPPAMLTAAIEAVFTLVQNVPAFRKSLAKVSLRFFCWYYLEMDLWDPQIDWGKKFLRSKKHLQLAPRKHGKSEFLCRGVILWLICFNRDIRILVVSAAITLARDHVMLVRRELKDNPRLIADFGAFYHRSNRWTDTEVVVIRKSLKKDPTIRAAGMLMSVTGARCDVLIPDDIIDSKNINTDLLRAKALKYVNDTLMPLLETWGRAWAIGTRKHYDDVYSQWMKDPTWTHDIQRAIIRYPDNYEYVALTEPIVRMDESGLPYLEYYDVIIGEGDPGEVLCEAAMSMKHLLLIKKSFGSVVFEQEYQNNVVDDATALFKLAWLQACRDESLSYVIGNVPDSVRTQFQVVLQATDPSLITSKQEADAHQSDYMVTLSWGLKENGHRFLLTFFRDRGMSPADVQKHIVREYERVLPEAHAIEANSFGLIHFHNVVERTGYKFTQHITGGNKHDLYQGVPSLSVLFENGQIHLPYKTDEDKKFTDELIKEFHGLGAEPHDDIVMATWILDTVTSRYVKGQARLKQMRERAR